MQGTITKVAADRGFGFIRGAGGDVFFHCSALQGVAIEDLRAGQAVEYSLRAVSPGDKGPRAAVVRLIGTPAAAKPEFAAGV